MTEENSQFSKWLLERKFVYRSNNKSEELSCLYVVLEKGDVQVEYYAGWCTVYSKSKKVFSFELCADLSTLHPKFYYCKIPIKAIEFLNSIPNIIVPEGVVLYENWNKWDRKISPALRKEVLSRDGSQ